MRFGKAVVVGLILGLFGYIALKKRKAQYAEKTVPVSEYIPPDNSVVQQDESSPPAKFLNKEQQQSEQPVLPNSANAEEDTEGLSLAVQTPAPTLFRGLPPVDTDEKPATDFDAPVGDKSTAIIADKDFLVTDTSQKDEIEPLAHPGRRNPTGEHYSRKTSNLPKATIHCREGDEGWFLYLKTPEDREVVEIVQDGNELESGEEIAIYRFSGNISLTYEDGGQDQFDLDSFAPFYFKTDEGWERDGRLTESHSKGYFVVIAPLDMAEEFDELEEHEPDECSDPDFEAHFLAIGQDYQAINTATESMSLKGRRLYDIADKSVHGELYVGAPPDLVVSNSIGRARIVEETGDIKTNRWGENFDPHSQSIESVLNGKEGRFSIRTYLKGSRRTHESKPFRYFKYLERITIDSKPYTPDTIIKPASQSPITVKFEGSNELVKPINGKDAKISISDNGAVTVPRDRSIRKISCEFANRAIISVEIPNVWWRISDKNSIRAWNTATIVKLDEFKQMARMDDACIEMCLPSNLSAVKFGFGASLKYQSPIKSGGALFYLRDLLDDRTLETPQIGRNLHLSVQVGELTLRPITIKIPQKITTQPSNAPITPSKSHPALIEQPEPTLNWSKVKTDKLGAGCERAEDHHWVLGESMPGKPVHAIVKDGKKVQVCKKCNEVKYLIGPTG